MIRRIRIDFIGDYSRSGHEIMVTPGATAEAIEGCTRIAISQAMRFEKTEGWKKFEQAMQASKIENEKSNNHSTSMQEMPSRDNAM
jgi:hypothetical protein